MHEILRWQALGKTVDQIAELMGMEPKTISHIVSHPDYRALQHRQAEDLFAPVDDVIRRKKAGQMLEEASGNAAQALIELLDKKELPVEDGGLDATEVRLTATAILDRAGFGPVQRKAVRQRIEMDPILAQLLTSALKESMALTVEGEIVDVEDSDTSGSGE